MPSNLSYRLTYSCDLSQFCQINIAIATLIYYIHFAPSANIIKHRKSGLFVSKRVVMEVCALTSQKDKELLRVIRACHQAGLVSPCEIRDVFEHIELSVVQVRRRSVFELGWPLSSAGR